MKTKRITMLVILCITSFYANSQNIINTNSWTVGSGSVSGYGQNGSTAENSREYGTGPKGNAVLLWKASPDATSNADGGWNTSHYNIDPTKTYRLIVWIKKTNSTNGSTYFGFQSYHDGKHHSLKLNGTENNNPYFWSGDLPKLNKWYMLVGYVHGSNYNATAQYGGIYDPVTKQKVKNITDFKFKSTSKKLRHRAYLFYDTNTSDRQYFYAPRMELVNGKEPPVEELLEITNSTSTNLLNAHLSNWTIGSGSVTGFGQNGVTAENSRELGKNHIGEQVVLWKATPQAASGPDGGWNSSYYNINSARTHRFSVWIKKTNSNHGTTYFGCRSNNNILTLAGTVNNNAYFWSGDLPKLNRWYLLVGYVHKSSHTGTTNTGGIYDGTTGEKVKSITDFKFKSGTPNVAHRSYLFYDTNILDRQYFYEPRIDPITGAEPTINELLKINTDSKIIISYDTAGNQTQNFYCGDPKYCSPVAAKATTKKKIKEVLYSEDVSQEIITIDEDVPTLDHHLDLYPNPTKNVITLSMGQDLNNEVHTIRLYSLNSVLIKEIKHLDSLTQIDLSALPVGVYFLHLHLRTGKSITKKIVKQ